ncbi:MAG: IgGFc-binding protein, partial [Tannerella sp.]|nr:IgGFc-binding protein [Tannerella sp.]
MKKKLLLLFVSLLSLTAVAQDTEFWFATPIQIYGAANNYRGHGGFMFTNPTHRQATVTIEYYKDRSSDTTIIIPAYSYNHCYYTTKARMTSLVEEITTTNFGNPNFSGAVHITSNVGVMVYYITDYEALQETFLLKGKAAHGTAYSILGVKGSTQTSTNSSQPLGNSREPYISIAGTEDGTTVNINLKGNCVNYAAGNHTVTLNKGKVLILRGTSTSINLNGSYITSDKPISITAGTDGRGTGIGADDQCADQLVSDAYAGNVYVMPLTSGFKPNTTSTQKVMNFMEITAMEPSTNVQIDWGSGLTPLTTLTNTGDVFFSDSFSVYRQNSCATIVSDKPIHVMQITGHEASICHVPNFYATNTHQTSFYSYWELFSGKNIDPGVTLVYLDDSKDGITIEYPGQTETPLFDWIINNGVVVDGQGNVPQFTGWKYIRFTLPNPSNPLATATTASDATNKIVTVKSKTSVFQLAMSSSFYFGTNLTYLTAFNSDFSFDPDTVWTCPGIYTNLIGGIASYYKWIFPDGTIKEGASLNSVKAVQMGMYILEMTQGFNTITDTCWVNSINFSKNGTIGKSLTKPFKVGRPQEFLPSIDESAAQHMTEFKWTFEGGNPSTSTDPTPTVVF